MSTKQMKCSPPLKGRAHVCVSPQAPSYSALTPAALGSSCLEDFSTSTCDHYEISACQQASLNLMLHPVICSK